MGQLVFNPPNVSGWRQNTYWLTTSAMGTRYNMARNISWRLNETASFLPELSSASPADAVTALCTRFEITPTAATRSRLEAHVTDLRNARHGWAVRPNLFTLVMMTPEFNLA
jgi:hypothetical protein